MAERRPVKYYQFTQSEEKGLKTEKVYKTELENGRIIVKVIVSQFYANTLFEVALTDVEYDTLKSKPVFTFDDLPCDYVIKDMNPVKSGDIGNML